MNGLARTAGIRAWLDLAVLHEALSDDLRALSVRRHDGEARRRRSYVRAAFAYVEGLVFALKQATVATDPERFTQLEREALSEAPRGRVSGGRIREEPYKISLPDNVQFALAMFARLTGQPPAIIYGPGWEAFRLSIKVRDRLMHPRRVAEIDVTDAELVQLGAGIDWFAAAFKVLSTEVRRTMDAAGTLPSQPDDERGSTAYVGVFHELQAAERRLNGPPRWPKLSSVLGRVLDVLRVPPK